MENHLFNIVFIFCVVLITHLEAKPFSLNKAIAEHSERRLFETLTNSSPENTEESFPLKGKLRSSFGHEKLKELGDLILLNTQKKKRSPRKYKKKIQSQKPKLAKIPTKPRFKRKNPTRKLDLYDNEGINRRYIPLLRSISLLFDDILSTNSESNEVEDNQLLNPRGDHECTCSRKGDLTSSQSRPQQETVATTETVIPEVPIQTQATTQETHHTTPRHISTFRQNKNIPAILSRNTPSFRPNYNGIGKGNGTARHRNFENYFPKHRGNSKYATRTRGDETFTEDDAEDTYSDSRDNADGDAVRGGRISGDTRRNYQNVPTTEATIPETSSTEEIRGYVNDFKRNTSSEIGGDETKNTLPSSRHQTESPTYVSGFSRRLRGHATKNEIANHAESLQPKEFHEKGVLNVTLNIPGVKRKLIGAGFVTEKDQKDRTTNEGIESLVPDQNNKNKSTMVMIIDGYSVARDRDGKNQIAKKQYKYIN